MGGVSRVSDAFRTSTEGRRLLDFLLERACAVRKGEGEGMGEKEVS